jgi:hypothetical protein
MYHSRPTDLVIRCIAVGLENAFERSQEPRTATKRQMPRQDDARFNVSTTSIHKIEADGVQVFYREAGDVNAPVVLLLHGFPSSSFMFRELIPRLANDYRVIAPDLPGFGFTEVPSERQYSYTFDRLALAIDAFTPGTQDRLLRNLCLRLWRANRLSFGDGSP